MSGRFKNYITPMGLKKLMDEYDWYRKVERPRVCDIVSWAASLGDRSENADYQYGKKRLREIDKRMRFLGKQIDNAEVVDPLKIKSDQVQFGATVIVMDEEGEKKTFSIVGTDETDSAKGFISYKSPIGKSLLGKAHGDVVSVHTPKGEIEYEIMKVIYQKLEVGEFKC